MADTFTTLLHLVLPRLGKKPWHNDWYFNFRTIDQILGGMWNGDLVNPCAKCADAVNGGAITPFIQSVEGDLSGAASIPAGETHEIRVDHSTGIDGKVFDVPLEPIISVPNQNVNAVLLADRAVGLDATEYGGVFVIRIENHSDSTVNGADITWKRKGLVLT